MSSIFKVGVVIRQKSFFVDSCCPSDHDCYFDLIPQHLSYSRKCSIAAITASIFCEVQISLYHFCPAFRKLEGSFKNLPVFSFKPDPESRMRDQAFFIKIQPMFELFTNDFSIT